ncbi:MAG: hypothetical protein KKB51_15225 [Candidatus Riflebacteria bacterium]|nr:hypothetical protein [Candidatus Riflebacteria bacterium]
MIKQRKLVLSLLAAFLLAAAMLPACDDFYLEWRKIELSDEQPAKEGYFGLSEAVARLKSALRVERKLTDNWPNKIKLAFVGWGDNEQPADKQQTADVVAAFNLFFADNMIDLNPADFVDSPDFSKLASTLRKDSDDYAISFIVKSCSLQWKSFITKDISSMFKLRIVLQEKVEAECKLVDKEGKLVFMDTFSVNPSQLFDFNYENSGYVAIKAERYSSDLIMNVIADALPAPVISN